METKSSITEKLGETYFVSEVSRTFASRLDNAFGDFDRLATDSWKETLRFEKQWIEWMCANYLIYDTWKYAVHVWLQSQTFRMKQCLELRRFVENIYIINNINKYKYVKI